MIAFVCEHCDRPGSPGEHGLCSACAASPGIRVLYTPRPGDPPGWEEHLRELARRARAGLPLFPDRNDRPISTSFPQVSRPPNRYNP
ncbi:MAG: hypothetical protein ACKO23_02745 [Gemmataceae bacterium]